MAQTTLIELNDSANFIFDSSKVNIDNVNNATLKLQNNNNQVFNEDFADDTGFTYDPTKSEFVGDLLRQVDQRPANSIIGSTYSTSLDASFAADGFVDKSALIFGSPTISGGKMVCAGSDGVCYSDTIIGALSSDWVMKVKYTPNYTTSPPTNVNILSISQATGGTDDVVIFNSPSGNNIRVTANGLAASVFGTWNPTAGQEYVFEVFCVSNQVSVYIDNVQLGTAKTITPGQGTDSNFVHIGAYSVVYNVAQGDFRDFILYSIAPQTDVYDVPEFAYFETNAILPQFTYAGVGDIQLYTDLQTTSTSGTQYVIDGEYWTGSAWATSDGSYAQSNDITTIVNNLASKSVVNDPIITVVFPDSDTQNNIDDLDFIYTGQIYPTDLQIIQLNTSQITISADQLIDFIESVSVSGSDSITYVLERDTAPVYWDGAAWVTSDKSIAQSNTVVEVLQGSADFLQEGFGAILGVNWLLKSDDGSSTPQANTLTIEYDFFGEQPTLVESTIYSTLIDLSGSPIEGQEIKVRPVWILANRSITSGDYISTTTNVDGYWEIDIQLEDVPPDYLVWDIKGKIFQTRFVAGNNKYSTLPQLYR